MTHFLAACIPGSRTIVYTPRLKAYCPSSLKPEMSYSLCCTSPRVDSHPVHANQSKYALHNISKRVNHRSCIEPSPFVFHLFLLLSHRSVSTSLQIGVQTDSAQGTRTMQSKTKYYYPIIINLKPHIFPRREALKRAERHTVRLMTTKE